MLRQEWLLKGLLWMTKFGLSVTAVCPLSMISNVGYSKWKIRKFMELSEIRECMLRHGMLQLDFRLHKSRVLLSRSNLFLSFSFHFLYFLLSMPFIFLCRHLVTFLLFIALHFCFPFFYSLSTITLCSFFLSFFLSSIRHFSPFHLLLRTLPFLWSFCLCGTIGSAS
jgi:hypothetical protein